MDAAPHVPQRQSGPWAVGRAHCVHEQSMACSAGMSDAQRPQLQPAACSAGGGLTAIAVCMPDDAPQPPTQPQAPARCAKAPTATVLAGRDVVAHAEHAHDGWCAPFAHGEQPQPAPCTPLGRACCAGRNSVAAAGRAAAGRRSRAAGLATARCILFVVVFWGE